MIRRHTLLPLALLLGAAPLHAADSASAPAPPSPRAVPAAFPTPQETTAADMIRHSLAQGEPATLNGIQQTVLPNGLTVLTKEVHAAPVVYFSVYYKVGSLDEEVGETGMSHLMEHMMFKGTKTRGPGVISATLQNNGADFNASTSFDRTEYHETLAADRLELAMQIESDRMVNSAYDEAQHQKEMTVVRSEYEAGENDPGTALGKAVRLAAFQVNPYRWETIGFKADIENFTRDEMYAYYQNYYAPNNAVVVIVGDFDTAKALDLARKYFGPIPPHPIAQHFITPEPVQEGERRVVVRRAGYHAADDDRLPHPRLRRPGPLRPGRSGNGAFRGAHVADVSGPGADGTVGGRGRLRLRPARPRPALPERRRPARPHQPGTGNGAAGRSRPSCKRRPSPTPN